MVLFPFALATLLALPALGFVIGPQFGDDTRLAALLTPALDETAVRFLILAMIARPLSQFWGRWRPVGFLVAHRTAFVAAAGLYALLYLFLPSELRITQSIWLGWHPTSTLVLWAGLVLLLGLCLWSLHQVQAQVNHVWQKTARLIYPAAALSLAHWALLHDWAHPLWAIAHAAPLIAAEASRYVVSRNNSKRDAPV